MPNSLKISLVNNAPPGTTVYAYITGLALQHSNRRVFVKHDSSLYFPSNPSKILQPLEEDCAIVLGNDPKVPTVVTIPQIAGGRIWYSYDSPLTFLRNQGGPGGGAALVEPSVLNPTDPNNQVNFGFCEFTLDPAQLFANISYVDFVSGIPAGLTLKERNGNVQHVSGMAEDGLERVCQGLMEQTKKDGWPWEKLIVMKKGGGQVLRVLSPTHAGAAGVKFDGFFEPLVERAWRKYAQGLDGSQSNGHAKEEKGKDEKRHRLSALFQGFKDKKQGPSQQSDGAETGCEMHIDTQTPMGILSGCIPKGKDELIIGGEAFQKPTTADILGCNSGPFTTGPSPKRNAIIPRLAAAFQRSCIGDIMDHPSPPETFYCCEPTNHYCRIVHECNLDGKGYAFAYDDVQPDGGTDQSGKVNAGDPEEFIVSIGGRGAYVGDRMP
ncbi:glycoside hydrolase family 64 protein [Apiosordaria backusii]|uniref:Glycoside hydrolase family 64 protein n=1 Tax=Apiosordaria backusii TaxID=314023 RepID=A0AA40BSH4_9PEZI|nr:glycoside hydrolase family 64 protein [Apiosordaria backusii]